MEKGGGVFLIRSLNKNQKRFSLLRLLPCLLSLLCAFPPKVVKLSLGLFEGKHIVIERTGPGILVHMPAPRTSQVIRRKLFQSAVREKLM